jgi:hypothetical protein
LKPPTNDSQGGPRAEGGTSGSGKSGEPGGSGGAAGASNSSATYSVADTNKDGVVSAREPAIYAIFHPSARAESTETALFKLDQSERLQAGLIRMPDCCFPMKK